MTDDDIALLHDAARRAITYRQGLDARPAQPDPAAVRRLQQELSGPLPARGLPAAEVLDRLDRLGSPATTASAGGRYFGFVVGSSLPVSVAASWLATAWDQNAALAEMSPVAAHLDEVAISWLSAALRLPAHTTGGLVTGATTANIVALAAARTHLLARAGWDVESQGLFGAPELRVVVGAEAHASVFKALMVLGLGRDRVVVVPADDQGRLRADHLPPLDARTIVCVQAGHVHTGALDPVGAVVEKARAAGAWVHVDGAFGLWARASERLAPLTAGLEGADSWATDAHKWLNVPYDAAAVLTVHDAAVRRAMSAWGPLLSEARQPAAYTLEQSRRARGVDICAALLHLGREGLATLVDTSCDDARRLAGAVRDEGLEVPHEVVLNQVLVGFGSDARTALALAAINDEGAIACTGATWRGRRYVRVSISSFATTADDVTAAVEALRRAREATAGS